MTGLRHGKAKYFSFFIAFCFAISAFGGNTFSQSRSISGKNLIYDGHKALEWLKKNRYVKKVGKKYYARRQLYKFLRGLPGDSPGPGGLLGFASHWDRVQTTPIPTSTAIIVKGIAGWNGAWTYRSTYVYPPNRSGNSSSFTVMTLQSGEVVVKAGGKNWPASISGNVLTFTRYLRGGAETHSYRFVRKGNTYTGTFSWKSANQTAHGTVAGHRR